MRTRARVLGLLSLVAVAAAFGFQAGPAQSSGHVHSSAMHGRALAHLRSNIVFHRHATWKWQDRAGTPRTPSGHAETHTRSWVYLQWIRHLWAHRQSRAHHAYLRLNWGSVPTIICRVFRGSTCHTARTIAWRESRYLTTAWNSSDHGGLFQLGTGERATYALRRFVHGHIVLLYRTAYEQVVAARNLWRARGWEPWTCCEG